MDREIRLRIGFPAGGEVSQGCSGQFMWLGWKTKSRHTCSSEMTTWKPQNEMGG